MSNFLIYVLFSTVYFIFATSTPSEANPKLCGDDNIHVVCKPSEDGLPVFIPHPYKCNKYFECQGTVGVAMICPDTLVFDPILNICNWPWNVDCEDKPYPGDCCKIGKVST